MQSKKNERKNVFSKRVRMKTLVERTGLPKSTILYYLSKGLIPEPVHTRPNMAYYDANCIDRIRLIRHLQKHHRLSLSEIKNVIANSIKNADLSARMALDERVFGSPERKDKVSESEFCNHTGLTGEQVHKLLEKKLLLPIEMNMFDPQDIAMGQYYARALSWGIEPDDLTYYVEFGEKIVQAEIELREKITKSLPYNEDTDMTAMMVNNARMGRAYIIDRLFQHRIAAMSDIKDSKSPKIEIENKGRKS